MIGAHPDDEDTELLTTLVRGYGVEAAYLALNRGEGGQNLIGSELGEGLGILRSEELLAARRLDGGRQFFTRAYDFGFSKTLADTWAHWPQDSILKDVVRIIREFRPQIIVSIFSGTPRDGHGQHQAAGWAAQEAFRIAGDSTRFPELETEEHLSAWTPEKLYRNTRFDTAGTTIRIDGGQLDPAVGQTFHQIAMRGRSLHRSQDMGQLQGMGASENRMMLWADRTGSGRDGLFSGIDTSLSRAAAALGGSAMGTDPVRAPLDRYAELVQGMGVPVAGAAPKELTKRLFAARQALDRAEEACAASQCARGGLAVALSDQSGHLDRALFNAEGILVDALVADDRVVPGSTVNVVLVARNTGTDTVQLCHRFGWLGHTPEESPVRLGPGQATQWEDRVNPAMTERLSQPYFLEQARNGDLYTWPKTAADQLLGLPFERGMGATIVLADPAASSCAGGASLFRELSYRTNDQARGEVRRPLWVVPRVDLTLDPVDLIWPVAPRTSRKFTVTLSSNVADSVRGTVSLEVPAGWTRPEPRIFRLAGEDSHTEISFDLSLPAAIKPGKFVLRAVATDQSGATYSAGQIAVDYPHIRPRTYVKPATAEVTIAAVTLPRLARIGYVRGAADKVPEALIEAGLPIEMLDRTALEHGDLSRYQAIVIGPRAYETDTALVRNNERLFQYARQGGLVLVQYQQQIWFNGGYSPFPATLGGPLLPLPIDSAKSGAPRTNGFVVHDRVTDEGAAVKIIDPASPILRRPNQIGASDWDGWIQERGLYFARTWDKAWHPVLEMHDPGEAPLDGGLLIARMGKGTFVYTGLSFFRQLPGGVAGSLRLFANLLALAEPAPTS
jgi:LmbE family N-acetylglucosaminyl deacetylase